MDVVRTLGTVLTLAKKDLRLLLRDPVDVFFVTGFPLVFAVLFGLIYSGGGGGGGEMSVLAVDRDGTAVSAALIDRLDASDAVAVERIDDVDAGRDRVRTGDAVAMIVVPAGYGDGVTGIFTGRAPPAVGGAIDPARMAEAGVLEGVATAAGFEVMIETLSDAEVLDGALVDAGSVLRTAEGVDPITRGLLGTMIDTGRRLIGRSDDGAGGDPDGEGEASDTVGFDGFRPIELELESIAREPGKRPASGFEVTFPQAAAWAVLGCVSGFGMSLVRERSSGTLLRLAVAPMARTGVIAGKALACFVATVAVLAVLYGVGAAAFGVRIASPFGLAAAIGSTAFGFVGVMMCLGSISQTEGGAEGFVRAMLLVMALIGGAGIPLFFMPGWMQTVSGVSPFRWAIIALEGASFRGFSVGELAVPCGVLMGIGAVGMGLASMMFKRWSVS